MSDTSLATAASNTPTKASRVPPRIVVHITMRLRQFIMHIADRMLPAPVAVLEHAHSFVAVHILAAIAELGIADQLATGPKTADELASAVDADSDAVHRVLRAAAVVGIVRLDGRGYFHATRLTQPLRTGDPSRTADWCRVIGSAPVQAAWADLAQTVRTGENAFHRVTGNDWFSWFAAHPEDGKRFAAGLGGLTRADAATILAAYRFPESGVVCDVAGGAGVLLGEILRANPGLRGVLVESPMVLSEAAAYLDEIGVADRVELVEGDLFEGFKVTADIYLLKWILHDWDDRTCKRIIENITAAMTSGTRLVAIEGDQEPNRAHPRFSMIDAQMLTCTEGGRERPAREIARLLESSGLRPGRQRHTATDLVLVEGVA
jgi:hypothetical protein